MGGRGAGLSDRYSDGGLSVFDILGTEDMVSMRESGKQQEVDEALNVMRDMQNKYGTVVESLDVATLKESKSDVMAYCSEEGRIGVNKKYFNAQQMTNAYDSCTAHGFHPSRGNKTGTEATIAHEYGHHLTFTAAKKHNLSSDAMAKKICNEARKESKSRGVVIMANKISRYASASNHETIAEALSDVYCNGSRAKRESKAVVNALDRYVL